MTALPRIGDVLDLDGRRAVVIGLAGTENRARCARRPGDAPAPKWGSPRLTTTGVHAQYLDTGGLVTMDSRSARAVPRTGRYLDAAPLV